MKFRILMLTLNLFAASICCGQRYNIDSLSALYPESELDSLSIQLKTSPKDSLATLYVDVGWELYFRDRDAAIHFAKLAGNISHGNKDSTIYVHARHLEAHLLASENPDSSILIYSKILPMVKKLNMRRSHYLLLNKTGLIYLFQLKLDRALDVLFEASHLEYVQTNRMAKYAVLNNIGLVYYKMEQYEKAEKYYAASLREAHRLNEPSAPVMLFHNISLCKSHQGQFVDAKKYVDSIESVCHITKQPKDFLSYFFAKGVCEFKSKKMTNAKDSFQKALQYAQETGDVRLTVAVMNKLGEIHINFKKFEKAERVLKDAEKICVKSAFTNEALELYTSFILLYENTGDLSKTVEYQKRYIQVTDSARAYRMTNNLVDVETEFEEKQNRERIQAQEKEIAVQAQVLSRRRIVSILLGVMMLLLVGLMFALYKNNRYKAKMNEMLDDKIRARTFEMEQRESEMRQQVTALEFIRSKESTDYLHRMNNVLVLASLIDSTADLPQIREYSAKIKSTVTL